MAEVCGHAPCGFENRLLYCEVEAADSDGVGPIVADQIEELLYDLEGADGWGFEFSANKDGHSFTRVFLYQQTDHDVGRWPLETRLTLCHDTHKPTRSDSYYVELAWRLIGSGDRWYITNYWIEVPEGGKIRAFMEEPDLVQNSRGSRAMTDYDYQWLFDQLAAMQAQSVAERA